MTDYHSKRGSAKFLFPSGPGSQPPSTAKEVSSTSLGSVCPSESHGGFEYLIAIRLPEYVATTKKGEEEQKRFTDFMHQSYKGKSPRDALLECIIDRDAKERAQIECGDDKSLQGALNCILDIVIHLLRTIARSHKSEGGRIEILQFASIEKNKLFIATRMNRELGEELADVAAYPVQLSMNGVKSLGIKLFNEDDPPDKKKGFVPAWVKFQKGHKDKIQLRSRRRDEGYTDEILRDMDRIRLLYNKITDYVDIPALTMMFQSQDITLKVFPAHNELHVADLRKNWAGLRHLCAWNQPIDDIQSYFGETVAFRFLFYNFVRQALFVLGVLCLLMHGFYHSPLFDWFSHEKGWQEVAQAIVFLVWYLVFEKMWYRTEAFYANRWGADYTVLGSAMKARRNPDFVGKSKPWAINLNMTRLAPDPWTQRWGRFLSVLVTMMYIALAMVLVHQNRKHADWVSQHTTTKISVPDLLLALQIHFADRLWHWQLGPRLSKWEKHTYMHSMEDSMAEKYSIFTFFNTFQAFIWIAYMQPVVLGTFETCPDSQGFECSREVLSPTLRNTYMTMVLARIVVMFYPRCFILYKNCKQQRDLQELGLDRYEIGSLEEQTKMQEYDAKNAVKDYLSVISAIGFVALFGAIAPVLVFGAYVAVTFQHRTDAISMCVNYQRTFPDRVENIGFWNSMLAAMRIAVLINTCALVCASPNVNFFLNVVASTGGNATDTGETGGAVREVSFFHLIFAALLFMYLVDALVSTKGPRTVLEKRRQQHQRQTLFSDRRQKSTEMVEIQGKADWKASKYHEVPQLRPGHNLYRPRMKVVGGWV